MALDGSSKAPEYTITPVKSKSWLMRIPDHGMNESFSVTWTPSAIMMSGDMGDLVISRPNLHELQFALEWVAASSPDRLLACATCQKTFSQKRATAYILDCINSLIKNHLEKNSNLSAEAMQDLQKSGDPVKLFGEKSADIMYALAKPASQNEALGMLATTSGREYLMKRIPNIFPKNYNQQLSAWLSQYHEAFTQQYGETIPDHLIKKADGTFRFFVSGQNLIPNDTIILDIARIITADRIASLKTRQDMAQFFKGQYFTQFEDLMEFCDDYEIDKPTDYFGLMDYTESDYMRIHMLKHASQLIVAHEKGLFDYDSQMETPNMSS